MFGTLKPVAVMKTNPGGYSGNWVFPKGFISHTEGSIWCEITGILTSACVLYPGHCLPACGTLCRHNLRSF